VVGWLWVGAVKQAEAVFQADFFLPLLSFPLFIHVF